MVIHIRKGRILVLSVGVPHLHDICSESIFSLYQISIKWGYIENSPSNQTNTHAPHPTHIHQPNAAISDQSLNQYIVVDNNTCSAGFASNF